MVVGHLFFGSGLCPRSLEEQSFHPIQQVFSIPAELLGFWECRRYPRQSEPLLGEGMIWRLRWLKQSIKGGRCELSLPLKASHSFFIVFKVWNRFACVCIASNGGFGRWLCDKNFCRYDSIGIEFILIFSSFLFGCGVLLLKQL